MVVLVVEDDPSVLTFVDRVLTQHGHTVLAAEDPDPNIRLQNVIAKRRAKRALSKQAMEDCGFAVPTKAK